MLAHNALSYVFSQSGFFKRAAFRTMPKYQGVKICKKEQYQVNQGFLIVDTTKNKKHWITSWTEKTQYYWWKHYKLSFFRQWNGLYLNSTWFDWNFFWISDIIEHFHSKLSNMNWLYRRPCVRLHTVLMFILVTVFQQNTCIMYADRLNNKGFSCWLSSSDLCMACQHFHCHPPQRDDPFLYLRS